MLVLELEQVVEQRDEQRLARLGAEDPLEDEVCLGVGEGGQHQEDLRLVNAQGNGPRQRHQGDAVDRANTLRVQISCSESTDQAS